MANDAYAISLPAAHALESILVLVFALMDMYKPIGTLKAKTMIPESKAVSLEDQVFNLQSQAVVSLITEIVENADIVGQAEDGRTAYFLCLSAKSSDTLAALFSDMEDGDVLDAGEEAHDGCEPED